jgi:hypothetical protein
VAPGILTRLINTYIAMMVLNGTNPVPQVDKIGNESFDKGGFAAVFLAYDAYNRRHNI